MAGLGYKDFTAGAVLTAAQVDGYLMEQAVMNFANTAARGSALSSVQSAGMMAHVGGGTLTVYTGTAWQQFYPQVLNLVAGTTVTAVSAINMTSVFSSTYQNYLLVSNFATGTATDMTMRLRAGTADNTAAVHSWNYNFQTAWSGTASGAGTASATSFTILANGRAVARHAMYIFSPNEAVPTLYTGGLVEDRGGIGLSGYHSAGSAFDGLSILGPSMTGTFRIYGLGN